MKTKRIFNPRSKVFVVFAMLLGFVMMGLTSYYLYAGYVSEKDSSAASCRAQAYECSCKDGTKQKINYSYCARGASAYDSCKNLESLNLQDKEKLAKNEKERNTYLTSAYANVRKNVDNKDGADNILNAKECFEAKWCKTETVKADGTFDWKTDGTSKMYQRYVEFMKKFRSQKEELEKKMAQRETQMRKETCTQVKAGYDNLMNKDRVARCLKACGTLKTPTGTVEKKGMNILDRVFK